MHYAFVCGVLEVKCANTNLVLLKYPQTFHVVWCWSSLELRVSINLFEDDDVCDCRDNIDNSNLMEDTEECMVDAKTKIMGGDFLFVEL